MRISSYQLTRFQFARDRVIGDSQVRADEVNVAALELIDETGKRGLGFVQTLFIPLPALRRDRAGVRRRGLARPRGPAAAGAGPSGQPPARRQPARLHPAVPRGHAGGALGPGRQAAVDLPLHRLLGSRRDRVRAYASRPRLPSERRRVRRRSSRTPTRSATPPSRSRSAIPDFDRDLHRLELLSKAVRPGAPDHDRRQRGLGRQGSGGQARRRSDDAGYDLLWVEDPILRNDFEGLRLLRESVPVDADQFRRISRRRRQARS